MKRILSLVLILILSVGILTACELPWIEKAPSYDLENAKGALVDLYPTLVPTKDQPVPSTIENYNLTKVLPLKDATYTVEWASDHVRVQVKDYVPTEEGDKLTAENTVTVHVPERPETGEDDITYALRALITAPDGSTIAVVFNLRVAALNPNTFAEFMAAEKDAEVTVSGVVTAIIDKNDGNQDNGVYFQDADGGYYAYKVSQDVIDQLEIGMTVLVSGKRGTYGTAQITDPSVKILDTTIKTVEPTDFTELVKNAAELSDATLSAKNCYYVTIKGVKLGNTGDNGYYYFTTADGRTTYFRISSSNNPMNEEEKAALIQTHADNYGATCDITGIVSLYNGNLYITPVGGNTISNIVVSTCEHTGGTATCKDQAVCELCGASYGELAAHVGGTATCTTFAKCDVCENGYGKLAAHTFTDGVCVCGVTNVISTEGEYLLGMIQPNKGATYYFTGAMSSYYFATSTEVSEAVKVKLVAVEGVEGAYHISFVDADGNTKYLSVFERDGSPKSSSLAIENNAPANYFTYNSEYNTFVCTFTNSEGDEVSYFLGTYGTNVTLSGSATKYLAQGNFVASLFVVTEGGNEGGETPSAPTTVEEILNALYALADGETLAGEFTLTGKITNLDDWNNPTIVVEGFDSKPVYCFKLKDDRFVVGATITVSATTLKNYKGTYELEGCTLVEITLPEGSDDNTDDDNTDDDNTGSDVVVGDSITLDFTTATGKNTKLDNASALTVFNKAGGEGVLTSVTVENVYDGNGTGGAFANSSGFIKMGKSGGDGTLVMNFGDKKVAKVEIKCHDWYKKSADHPTNSNTVSVNGSAEVLAPYTEDGTYGVLTFVLDEATNEITIVSNDRIFVLEIVVYFAE